MPPLWLSWLCVLVMGVLSVALRWRMAAGAQHELGAWCVRWWTLEMVTVLVLALAVLRTVGLLD